MNFLFWCSLVAKVVSDSFASPWAVAHQASLPVGFPRQEYWGGLPFPSPGDPPDPGIEPTSPVLADRFFTAEPPGKPNLRHSFKDLPTCHSFSWDTFSSWSLPPYSPLWFQLSSFDHTPTWRFSLTIPKLLHCVTLPPHVLFPACPLSLLNWSSPVSSRVSSAP